MKQTTVVDDVDNTGLLLDENYNLRKQVERLQCQLDRANEIFKASQQELYSLEIQFEEEKKQTKDLREQVQYLQTRSLDNTNRSFSPETIDNYFVQTQRRSSVPNKRQILPQNTSSDSKNELKEMNQKIDEMLRERKRIEQFYQVYSINQRLTERVNALQQINSTLKQALQSKDNIIKKGEALYLDSKEKLSYFQKQNQTARASYISNKSLLDQITTAVCLFDKGTINGSKFSKMLHRLLNISAAGISATVSQVDHPSRPDLSAYNSRGSRNVAPSIAPPSILGDHASYTSSESPQQVSKIEELQNENIVARSVSPKLQSHKQQVYKQVVKGQPSLCSYYESDDDTDLIRRSGYHISLERQLNPFTPVTSKTPVMKSPGSDLFAHSRYADTQVERSSEFLSRNQTDLTNYQSFGRVIADRIDQEEKHPMDEPALRTPEMGKFMQSPGSVTDFDINALEQALEELSQEQRLEPRERAELMANFKDFKFDQRLKDSKLYMLMSLLYKKIQKFAKPSPPSKEAAQESRPASQVPPLPVKAEQPSSGGAQSFRGSNRKLGKSIMESIFTPRIRSSSRPLLAPQSIVAKIVQSTKENIDHERQMARTVY